MRERRPIQEPCKDGAGGYFETVARYCRALTRPSSLAPGSATALCASVLRQRDCRHSFLRGMQHPVTGNHLFSSPRHRTQCALAASSAPATNLRLAQQLDNCSMPHLAQSFPRFHLRLKQFSSLDSPRKSAVLPCLLPLLQREDGARSLSNQNVDLQLQNARGGRPACPSGASLGEASSQPTDAI